MTGIRSGKQSIGDFFPSLQEGHNPQTGGIQRFIVQPMGPPLLVNGATYRGVVFVAPCDGCQIKELWVGAAVAIAGGTDTLAVDNYDKSATAARNALSTTNIDPTTVTALQGLQLTLSTTESNLLMDEGDVLNFTLVCGTMTTAGQGFAIMADVWVPDVL